MVKYWKSTTAVKAKVTEAPEGHYIMELEGEKYPIASFPRGSILLSSVSKLKHEIKNQIFNETWAELEDNNANISKLLKRFDNIIELVNLNRMNMLPYERLCPSVKEIWRAWTEVEKIYPGVRTTKLKEAMCFILQEDDSYRFRVQWMAKFLTLGRIKNFERALQLMEHAEVVGDMKERIRLLRRVLMLILTDQEIKKRFEVLFEKINWKKIKLTKADKYYFRAKYFKVDYPLYEY